VSYSFTSKGAHEWLQQLANENLKGVSIS
jgi:hypothetical protein